MSDLAVSPVQSQGITGTDVGITAGAAALGALGGGAMYFKTPSEDKFIASGLKLQNKELASKAETLTAALKELSADGGTLSDATKTALKDVAGIAENEIGTLTADTVKGKLTAVVGEISDQKVFDKVVKNANKAVAKTFADDYKMGEQVAETAKTGIKEMYGIAKDNIKKAANEVADNAKKPVEYLKKAKMSAALKWGGIAAGAAALIAAATLFFTRGNNTAEAEQPAAEQA